MKFHDVQQGTPEWLEIRKGKLTASNAQAIGNNGKGLDTYVMQVMADKYAQVLEDQHTNKDIERGLELEDQARSMYELETGSEVEQVGFISEGEYIGASPDGLVSNTGLIEIKCMNNAKHFNVIVKGLKGVDSKYLWQVQMQMLVAQRNETDLIIYNPNFEQSLLIFRIEPNKVMQDKLSTGLEAGVDKIKAIEKDLNK